MVNTTYRQAVSKYQQNKNLDLLCELAEMEIQAKNLKRLRKLTNELLSNGAYSEKNMEDQLAKLRRANAPKEYIETIKLSWEIKAKLSKHLIKQLKQFLKKLGGLNEEILHSNKQSDKR